MITVRLADPADNEGLIELTSITPMDGKIAIRTDRHPDFFRLLRLRGTYVTCVAESDHHIIGCLSVVQMPCLLQEKDSTLLYICDLKVHPSYRKGIVAHRMIRAMTGIYFKDNDRMLYSNVANGNREVMPFFGGRAGLPPFTSPGHFNVFQVIPVRKMRTHRKYRIEESADTDMLLEAYRKRKQSYQLCFLPNRELLERSKSLIALDPDGNMRACLTLFDSGFAKQNVLLGLPFFLRAFVNTMRFLNRISHFINLPEYDEKMKILYVSHFFYETGHNDAISCLIDQARIIAFNEGYIFLSIGLYHSDPANAILRKYRKFTFRSVALLASPEQKDNDSIGPDTLIYEDFSLV